MGIVAGVVGLVGGGGGGGVGGSDLVDFLGHDKRLERGLGNGVSEDGCGSLCRTACESLLDSVAWMVGAGLV